FNEIPYGVYREYTVSLAYDVAQTRQKYAFSDHSDLVARRMGFIPLPLGVTASPKKPTQLKFLIPDDVALRHRPERSVLPQRQDDRAAQARAAGLLGTGTGMDHLHCLSLSTREIIQML
ncbi:Protein TAPT1-like protein, partial [Operophtera brumata]